MTSNTPIHDTAAPVYNLSLLLAFVANVFQLTALSLLFRYSDFVENLGGDESHLGWIVGISTIGAILFRFVQGAAIDRAGPKLVWILSLVAQVIAIMWHVRIESVTNPEVYLARALFAMGIAGNFGAWLSFISLQAPAHRVAEVIGVVGASGFVGMALGPTIGDWIMGSEQITRPQVNQMFYIAAGITSLALIFAGLACLAGKSRELVGNRHRRRLNSLVLLWQSRPGFILVVGMTMGLVIGFPGTYVRPLAESLDIDQIKVFFLVYNGTAFVSRLTFRRAPQLFGLRVTILIGFGFFFLSNLLYLTVQSQGGFWLPAAAGGLGHSFLFPSVVTACTEKFQKQSRGMAMNLILAMYDLGVFVGMPLIGLILTQARQSQLPEYPLAIAFVCLVILLVSLIYLLAPGNHRSGDPE